jgi:hypothetical protein
MPRVILAPPRCRLELRWLLPSELISVLFVDSLYAQEALQKLPRPACITTRRLQPRNTQALVSNLAMAPSDMLFDLVEVASKYGGVHL